MLSRPIEKHGSNCIIFPNCLLVKMPKECLKFHHLAKAYIRSLFLASPWCLGLGLKVGYGLVLRWDMLPTWLITSYGKNHAGSTWDQRQIYRVRIT